MWIPTEDQVRDAALAIMTERLRQNGLPPAPLSMLRQEVAAEVMLDARVALMSLNALPEAVAVLLSLAPMTTSMTQHDAESLKAAHTLLSQAADLVTGAFPLLAKADTDTNMAAGGAAGAIDKAKALLGRDIDNWEHSQRQRDANDAQN